MENDNEQQTEHVGAVKKVDIASIYPTAKSYDERQLEHSVVVERRESRVAKETQLGPVYIAIGSAFGVLLTVYVLNYVPHLLEDDPLGGPRTALLLMMAAVAINIFISWQTVRYAELKAGRSLIYFAAYLVSFAPQLYAWRVFEPLGKYDANAMVAVTIADFIIVMLLSWVVFSKRFSGSTRVAVIVIIIAASLVAAFIAGATQSESIIEPESSYDQYFPNI